MSEAIKLTKFAGLIRSGVSLDKALDSIGGLPNDSLGIRYLLEVAIDSGSSISKEIEFVANLVSVREGFKQRIGVAHASPKATASLVISLPVLTLVMAQVIGWNVLGSIQESPIVLVSLFAGGALLGISKLITSRMLKAAKPKDSYAGFFLLGVALESASGASILQAQTRALNIYEKVFGKKPSAIESAQLVEVEELVQNTGAQVGSLLRSQAQTLQQVELVKSEIKIEKLGVKLMLPLGLGVLPAFVFLTIVPLMVTTLGSK